MVLVSTSHSYDPTQYYHSLVKNILVVFVNIKIVVVPFLELE